MSFLDLYEGDQTQAAKIQPNEGARLPSGFEENFHAAWNDGLLFSQSIARSNARASVLDDYVNEIRNKTGNDLGQDFSAGPYGVTDFDAANARVAKLKENYPDLDLDPLSEDEIDKRAVAKATAAHRTYQQLSAGERTVGGSVGSFLGGSAAAVADPVNILALAVAPETGGASILGAALRWGALAGVSQAAIEAASDTFKEQVQPGYIESGQPLHEIGGAFVGGAVLGGGFKALGNAWTRVKTGAWPTSVRDAGNVLESEANVANTNPFPGVEGEVAHREALTKTIDDILAGRPVDVGAQITPELQAHFEAYHGSPHDFGRFDISKIGTGEGAQAYGHGMYFAENQKVAEGYRKKFDAVSGAEQDATLYKVRITADKDRMLDWDKPLSEQSPETRAAIEGLQREVLAKNPNSSFATAEPVESGATLYERYMIEYELEHRPAPVGNMTEDYNARVAGQRAAREAATKAFSDAGIPGIKYLDNGSRFAAPKLTTTPHGDVVESHYPAPTSNFVIFNDKHVEITHKNGKPVNAEIRQGVIDEAKGLPPKQPELPLAPDTEPMAPKRAVEPGPQPQLQTAEQMTKTLTEPDHQDAIRADIDRERALGDFKVPGIDENGNHTMVGVDAAMEEVDAYKKLADDIQVCASPPEEKAA